MFGKALMLAACLGSFATMASARDKPRVSGVVRAASAAPGYHVVDRIPLSDGWWDYANVDSAHRRLFVARGNGVFKMDLDSGLIDYRFVPGSEGRAVVPVPGGDTVVTTMAGYSTAIVFSGADGKVAKMIPLKQASDSAVWEPVGKRMWVMGGHGEASLLDPVTLQQTGSLELGEPLEFSATDNKGRVFVNASESSTLIAIDAPAMKVVGRWKMEGCEDPSGMAYVEDADVILSVCSNNVLKVVDARNGRDLGSVPVGKGADAVIYDRTTRRAYVPSAYDGLLTVLSVNGPRDVRMLEQVPTQIGTRTGAIDEKTGTLYLPTARFGPVNALGWPEALPGTVQLLVMKPAK